jgi:hypothetical protein
VFHGIYVRRIRVTNGKYTPLGRDGNKIRKKETENAECVVI